MIVGLLWLLGCQLVGEVLVRSLGVTVPGPVVGMVLLLVVLRLRRTPVDDDGDPVVRTSATLQRHLQLLFVPAGVGVVVYGGLLRHDAWPLGLALVGSWLLGLVTVAGVVTVLTRRRSPRGS